MAVPSRRAAGLKYCPCMREILLTGRKHPGLRAQVDDEDYERASQHGWWAVKFPGSRTFYAATKINRRTVYLHRFVMNFPEEVDHKDLDGLNCQKRNLRVATRGQQAQNRPMFEGPKVNPIYRGVKPAPSMRNPWRATITVGKKRRHLGVFPTPEDAARAYDTAALGAFGEYARVNFPTSPGAQT